MESKDKQIPAIMIVTAGWFKYNVIPLKIPTAKYIIIFGTFENVSLVG
jgi:hypothetical protein